jgi:hypothetical protein
VRKTTLGCAILKILVICLTSFPHYVNVAHFFFRGVLDLRVCFVFVGVIVISEICLYCIRFSLVCSYRVFPICFDFFVTGYVFNRFNRYLIPDNLCSYG